MCMYEHVYVLMYLCMNIYIYIYIYIYIVCTLWPTLKALSLVHFVHLSWHVYWLEVLQFSNDPSFPCFWRLDTFTTISSPVERCQPEWSWLLIDAPCFNRVDTEKCCPKAEAYISGVKPRSFPYSIFAPSLRNTQARENQLNHIHENYVWAYVWVCMSMYEYVWVCMSIWVCMSMYEYVWVMV